jgi:hypothetical protein
VAEDRKGTAQERLLNASCNEEKTEGQRKKSQFRFPSKAGQQDGGYESGTAYAELIGKR